GLRWTRSSVRGRNTPISTPFTTDRVWLEVDAIPELEPQGQVRSVLCSFKDVTAQLKAQSELRREHELLSKVMLASVAGIVVLDVEGQIVYANRAAEEILGLSRADLASRRYNAPEWKHTDVDGGPWPEEKMPFVQVMTTGKPVHDVRHAIEKPDGSRTILSINGAPLMGDKGTIERLVFAILDITQQHHQAAERERMRQEMENLARLRSLSVLAGGVAHDFNNLLAGIMGAASVLLEETPDHDPAVPMLKLIEQGSERAAELVEQLLTFAGHNVSDVDLIDISSTIQASSHLLRSMISKDASITFALAQAPPLVVINRTLFNQMVMNMVVNSSQAIEAVGRGTIVVRTGMVEVTAEDLQATPYKPLHARPGHYTVVEVEDDGVGLDPAIVGRIFEPFFTTKKKGHGLGLAAVLGGVRSHGGFVHLESEPHTRTLFRIGLPSQYAAPTPDAPSPYVHPSTFAPTGTILVVDDEPLVRAMVERALEPFECTVLMARNSSGPDMTGM
ncbi:MAG: PAS domain-containing protein, partial [Myxococcota bacterium]